MKQNPINIIWIWGFYQNKYYIEPRLSVDLGVMSGWLNMCSLPSTTHYCVVKISYLACKFAGFFIIAIAQYSLIN